MQRRVANEFETRHTNKSMAHHTQDTPTREWHTTHKTHQHVNGTPHTGSAQKRRTRMLAKLTSMQTITHTHACAHSLTQTETTDTRTRAEREGTMGEWKEESGERWVGGGDEGVATARSKSRKPSLIFSTRSSVPTIHAPACAPPRHTPPCHKHQHHKNLDTRTCPLGRRCSQRR